MKKWNTPEIVELNVSETANGIFDTWFESWLVHNDSDKKPELKPETPETPETPISPEEHLS